MNQTYKKILDIPYLPKIIKIMIIMGINWTFQSILYIDRTERAFKILFELSVFILIFIPIQYVLDWKMGCFIAIIMAHTINWTINGHFFALIKTFETKKTKKEDFLNYIENLRYKSEKREYLDKVFIYGSITQEKLNEYSDIDIRVVRKSGFINGIKSCFFVMMERNKSFFSKFPIDIYVFDDIKRVNMKETPIIIKGN